MTQPKRAITREIKTRRAKRPETEIREAARIMHAQKIGALPVVEGDRVVGMLTETDLLKVFVRVLEEGIVSKPERWSRGER